MNFTYTNKTKSEQLKLSEMPMELQHKMTPIKGKTECFLRGIVK